MSDPFAWHPISNFQFKKSQVMPKGRKHRKGKASIRTRFRYGRDLEIIRPGI